MTTDSQVDLEALLRSHAVPSAWTATFAWDSDYWINQENGMHEGPQWRPSRDDVEAMLNR